MTEHEKNLERGKVWKLAPYSGDFPEIDLNQDWYCPQCRDGTKLVLNHAGDCLYCPSHHELCEYEYHNAAGRDKYNVFWSAGFNYPLSHKELLIARRNRLVTEFADNRARIVSLKERNKEIELETQALSDELNK